LMPDRSGRDLRSAPSIPMPLTPATKRLESARDLAELREWHAEAAGVRTPRRAQNAGFGRDPRAWPGPKIDDGAAPARGKRDLRAALVYTRPERRTAGISQRHLRSNGASGRISGNSDTRSVRELSERFATVHPLRRALV